MNPTKDDEHLVLLDQLDHRRRSLLGVVGVIAQHQLDLAAVDARFVGR